MKKILVTGGAGFIGYHTVNNLIRRGWQVTVFDRYKPKVFREDCSFFLGDVKDRESVMEAVYHHDGVIHLAARLGTQESISSADESARVNILGSINVFDACKIYGRKAVYIAVGNHWMNNPYSITKTTAERFALMYNKEMETKIAIVRGLNAYGPHQKSEPVRKIMPNFIIPALKNEDIIIYGDGEQIMDMIYVEDMAEILVRALLYEHNIYDSIIEAGMGHDITVNQIAKLVIRIANSRSKIKHIPMRPGETPGSVVKATNFEPLHELRYSVDRMVSLEEGIRRTVEWYLQKDDEF